MLYAVHTFVSNLALPQLSLHVLTCGHRSADNEDKDGVSLPSYRGDIINGPEFTSEARVPDPWRLVRAYNQSAATLNLLRGFSTGGYAGLTRLASWNLDFMANSDEGRHYQDLVSSRHQQRLFQCSSRNRPSSGPAGSTDQLLSGSTGDLFLKPRFVEPLSALL
jgi:hypothetical protein